MPLPHTLLSPPTYAYAYACPPAYAPEPMPSLLPTPLTACHGGALQRAAAAAAAAGMKCGGDYCGVITIPALFVERIAGLDVKKAAESGTAPHTSFGLGCLADFGDGLPTAPTTRTKTSTTTRTTTLTATTQTLPSDCSQLDSVVDGVVGVYKGNLLTTVADVSTLPGCAAECYAKESCIYFAVSDTLGCQLRKTRGAFIKSGSFSAGMGECKRQTTTATPTTT